MNHSLFNFIDAKVRLGLSGGLASFICSYVPFFNLSINSSMDIIIRLLGIIGVILGLFSAYYSFKVKKQELRKMEIETAITQHDFETQKKQAQAQEEGEDTTEEQTEAETEIKKRGRGRPKKY